MAADSDETECAEINDFAILSLARLANAATLALDRRNLAQSSCANRVVILCDSRPIEMLDLRSPLRVTCGMRKVSFRMFLALTILAVVVAGPARAAGKKKPAPEPVRPFISAVNVGSVTVTTGATTKTLALKSNSEVLINGQKASPADLKTGMIVNNLGVGTDPAVVSRISVADAAASTQTGSTK
jgi:hypothetical protein